MDEPLPTNVLEAAQQLKFKDTIMISLTTAISLAIALYWKDVIQMIVRKVVPQKRDVAGNFFAAVIITILGVLAIYGLVIIARPPKHIKEFLKKYTP